MAITFNKFIFLLFVILKLKTARKIKILNLIL